MDYQDIRFELRDGVAVITLHRPEQRNAFSGRMGVELGRAYTACDQDDDVRAVVVTGAGDAFCAAPTSHPADRPSRSATSPSSARPASSRRRSRSASR